MEGDLSLVSVPDLLQMICLGGYNRDIHLFDGPTQLGVIAQTKVVVGGQVDDLATIVMTHRRLRVVEHAELKVGALNPQRF